MISPPSAVRCQQLEVPLSGMSRRAFLSSTAVLAGALYLPADALGRALAAPLKPSGAPTTLQQTIALGPVVRGQYRDLVTRPGEPYYPRIDITAKPPSPTRTSSRRSLAYLGHLSDIHVIDAQSPARLEPLVVVSSAFVSALHPQDTMTTQVAAAMVDSVTKARFSPVTGAPLTAIVNTGDNADSRSSLELDWYIKILDGVPVTPNSGKAGVYEGVQVWDDATYAWHPNDPAIDKYGAHGFPQIPGLLEKAVSQTVNSVGLAAPWYTVFGNHDTLFMGNLRVDPTLQAWAVGSNKAATAASATHNMLSQMATDTNVANELFDQLQTTLGLERGTKDVTADGARKLFDQIQFMQAHLNSSKTPGPIGHGFTSDNISTGQTWWSVDVTPYLRVLGLDTCNQVSGADGAVPQNQFDWLEQELAQAQQQNKLAIICSHHNSLTLENGAEAVLEPSQPLIHSEQFVNMLLKYPNMIAWLNGHTHLNAIIAHPRQGGGGFWEITTASCIDYPQQQQLVELIDNRDGTLSIFCTTIDHDSSANWTERDFSQTGLASLSRQLSANYWEIDPLDKIGSALDRNTELLLPAPFDLSKISDAAVEKLHNTRRAQIVAYEHGRQL